MAKVVIFSGAGISAESGISTFRDNDGLWDKYDVKKVATKGALETNRAETIEFYDKRRLDLKDKKPNKAHQKIVELKHKYPDEIAIITQNVDDLFEKAGAKPDEVLHLHGFMTKVECESCGFVYDIGYKKQNEAFNGKCPKCFSSKIRPHIVMFGELAPMYENFRLELYDCEMFVVIGTSGNVIVVDGIASQAKFSILNNLEKSDMIDDSVFDKVYYEPATMAITKIEKDIEEFLQK